MPLGVMKEISLTVAGKIYMQAVSYPFISLIPPCSSIARFVFQLSEPNVFMFIKYSKFHFKDLAYFFGQSPGAIVQSGGFCAGANVMNASDGRVRRDTEEEKWYTDSLYT